jgi:hypothetical protein
MFRILLLLFVHAQRLQQVIHTTRVAGQPEKLPIDQGDSFLMYRTRETRVGQIFELQTIRKFKAPYGSQIFCAMVGCFQMISLFQIKMYVLIDHSNGEECER